MNLKRLSAVIIAGLIIVQPFMHLGSEEKKDNPPAPKELTIKLKNGINIVGTLFEPRSSTNLTFVLLHGLGSTRHEWMSFAERLHTLGYGVYIYDARGHGDSTADENGNKINYETFPKWGKNSHWKLMVDDLDEILLYLEKLVGLDPKRFVLGGASLGANVALNNASRRKNIRGLILLSPGLDYAGVTTEYPMRFCRVPAIAIAASPGDVYAYESSKKLVEFKNKSKKVSFFEVSGSEHGVNLFKMGFDAELLDWIHQKIKHK